MPLYDFECKHCGHRFEKLIRFDQNASIAQCPQCEHTAEQIPSVPGKFAWGKSGGWN